MKLFLKRLKDATGKLFGFSFLVGIVVILFIFSGPVFLAVKHSGAFCYIHMGDDFVKKHKFEEAINYYNRALELYPEHVKARYNLGNIYVAYEDFDKAIECYQTVLLYNPNYIKARINIGLIFSEEKTNPDLAIEEYTKAVQATPIQIKIPFIYDNTKAIKEEKAVAYYNMGLAYRDKSLMQDQGSPAAVDFMLKAADCYRQSLFLSPKNYNAQYNLALTYHLLEKYTDALGGYCKAMFIAPLNYESYYNLAILLRQKGRFIEAAEEFQNAGNLSNIEGHTFKTSFIYGVFNEVSEMAIAQHGYKSDKVIKRIDSDIEEDAEKAKKELDEAVTPDELEKVLAKRLKTHSVCKSYLEEKE